MRIIVPASHSGRAMYFADNQEILTVEPSFREDGTLALAPHWHDSPVDLIRQFAFELLDYLEDCPLTLEP